MTWTYDKTDLSTSLNKVRLLIQDTDTDHQLMTDEEITFHIGEHANIYSAAAACCETLAAKFGRMFQRSVAGVTDNPQEQAKFYLELAARLRESVADSASVASYQIFMGGRTISGKADLAGEEDKTQPAFSVGLDDNPGHDQDGVDGRYSET